MFAKFFSAVLLAVPVLSLAALPLSAQDWVVYDDFKGSSSINPALWVSTGQGVCNNALECERQIQGGQLRLWIRGYGLTTTNEGLNWSQNGLAVSQSEWGITGIRAKLTVTRVIGNSCPGSLPLMIGQMGLRAVFFNSGDGTQGDDVEANLFMYPHSDQTIEVGGILHKLGTQERIGDLRLSSVNVGERVTISVHWDKVNKWVVYGLQRDGQSPEEGRISYGLPDIASVWYPYKSVVLQTSPPNCTSDLVSSDIEVKVDQVSIVR